MTTIIDSVTHHGMGRGQDGALYPRTLPGEEIAPQSDGTARILQPSAQRVSAPCRHFRQCGGCAMQHASDAFVAQWKQGIVEKALTAQGLDIVIAGTLTSPAQTRRRARLSGRRTKGGALLGFHARASGQIVSTPDCLLVLPSIQRLFPALETLVTFAATRTSEVALTVTDTPAGADVLVEGGRDLTAELRRDLAHWAETAQVARLTWGADPVALRAAPYQQMGPARVVPPPGAFLQATADGQAALLDAVLRGTAGARRVGDLFAGVGTFALPLAAHAEVAAWEGDGAMIAALQAGWRSAPGLHRLTAEARDLFRRPLMPEELRGLDAVVIDPPRAGAEAQMHELAGSAVPVVMMVSCNPVSFARDARILTQGGYRPGPLTVIDQFRWSAHVEMVCRFTKA